MWYCNCIEINIPIKILLTTISQIDIGVKNGVTFCCRCPFIKNTHTFFILIDEVCWNLVKILWLMLVQRRSKSSYTMCGLQYIIWQQCMPLAQPSRVPFFKKTHTKHESHFISVFSSSSKLSTSNGRHCIFQNTWIWNCVRCSWCKIHQAVSTVTGIGRPFLQIDIHTCTHTT